MRALEAELGSPGAEIESLGTKLESPGGSNYVVEVEIDPGSAKTSKIAHGLLIFSIWLGKTCSWLEAFHGHRLSWKGARRAVFLTILSQKVVNTHVFLTFSPILPEGTPLERDSLSLDYVR